MTLEWRGRTLHITWLPVASMGRLAALAPAGPEETQVLAALLAGARVCLDRRALEYRRYRRTAPAGIFRRRRRACLHSKNPGIPGFFAAQKGKDALTASLLGIEPFLLECAAYSG